LKKLRTLHIDTEKGWRGGEQQALYLMQGLLQRGHEVTLVCRAGDEFARRATAGGIAVRPIKPHGEVDPVNFVRIARWLRQEKFDVIHAHTAHAHTLAAAAVAGCSKANRPACVVSRRVDFSIHKLPLRLSGWKYKFIVDRYLAISQCVRDVLIADGIPAEKISIVYSSVEAGRYQGVTGDGMREKLGITAFAPVLVNVAMLVGHKGQTYLLQALPQVLQAFPHAICVIVGEGELRASLETEAVRLGVQKNVLFTGYRDDPLRCIAMADVFIMTSHMEGLCTSILDALSLGKPVVATRAGGMPEIIEHERNGLLAENRNPQSIAAQLIRILQDAPLRDRCIAVGRRTIAEKFSVEGLVEGTLTAYRELVK
jgi:L-malate glycosyltransferase